MQLLMALLWLLLLLLLRLVKPSRWSRRRASLTRAISGAAAILVQLKKEVPFKIYSLEQFPAALSALDKIS